VRSASLLKFCAAAAFPVAAHTLVSTNHQYHYCYLTAAAVHNVQVLTKRLLDMVNSRNIEEHYELGRQLGTGACSVVRSAISKVPGSEGEEASHFYVNTFFKVIFLLLTILLIVYYWCSS
jgi:hypothetical protein